MPSLNILIILILFGLADSLFLLYKNRPQQYLACPLNGNCQAVLGSRWNKFLGVKNEVWGLLYYLVLLILVILVSQQLINLQFVLLAIVGGVLYSSFLTYLQIFRLKAYCLYCFGSALVNLLLLLTALTA